MHALNALFASRTKACPSYVKPLCLALVALATLGLTACETPKGTVKITTSLGGVEIYINGERKGNSPKKVGQTFAVKIAEGEYKIEAKIPDDEYQYDCGSKEVVVSANTLQTVEIELERCLTKKGEQQKVEVEKLAEATKQLGLASDDYRNLPSRVQDFEINDNGTVYDKRTKLEWMRCSLGQILRGNNCVGEAKEYKWQKAMNTAKGYRFAGYTDWRVPTRWELDTLVYCSSGQQKLRAKKYLDLYDCLGNYKRPTILQSVFPNTSGRFYWSSSPDAYGYNDAWGVDFYYGDDYSDYKSSANPARLVRVRY